MVCAIGLSACDSAGEESGTAPEPDAGTTEVMAASEADADYSVDIDVPEAWYEVEPKEGFVYQYLWEGNDWDDILAQDFDTHDFEFSGDFFVGLLEPTFSDRATIELRDDAAEIGGHPAIIIDVVYDSGSYTSLTYVDVDGHLWEFTVNAQELEGLDRGEEINATATFSAL